NYIGTSSLLVLFAGQIEQCFRAMLMVKPESGTSLDQLLKQAIPLDPFGRINLLENSGTLELLHTSAATQGDTVAPDANEDVELHYVCFVKSSKDGHLYELDGARNGPV